MPAMPLHAVVERVRREAAEPWSDSSVELLLLQPHQDSPDTARNTSNGRRKWWIGDLHRSLVEYRRL